MIKNMWKEACIGLLFGIIMFGSCKNDIDAGGYLVDPHVQISMVDTLTLKISNLIAADSVITSGKGIGFAGSYRDPEIGSLSAQTYIEFARTTDTESNKYADFDSVVLIVRSDGSYYGDTLIRPSLKISKLVKQMELRDDGYMYSTSTVPVGDLVVDTTFRMRVGLKESVEIRLPDELGISLFEGIRDNEPEYDMDNFLKTFPGLTIAAGKESNCVHGYILNDTACMIRIYYHINSTYTEEKTMNFKAAPAKSFYHLNSDRLPSLQYTTKDDPVPSSNTDKKGVIMSGIPMFVMIEFPHLNNFLRLAEIVKIQSATLIVRPVYHSYDTVPLPKTLNLYQHDPTSGWQYSNSLSTKDPSGAADPLTGNLDKYINTQFPHYEFNITDFISAQIGAMGYNKWALGLAIPRDYQANTLQRLVIGDQQFTYTGNVSDQDNQIQLKVTYVTYNPYD